MDKTVVIIGLGWVGQANALALIKRGFSVVGYDVKPVNNIYKDPDFKNIRFCLPEEKKINITDNAPKIVCVNAPTEANGHQNTTHVSTALSFAHKLGGGPVILRTTILPTKLKNFDFDIYLPEFLHEAHAVKEVLNPAYIVVGLRKKKIKLPEFLKKWRESARKNYIGTPEEAAFIKYITNLWNSIRIAHVNEIGNIMRRRKINHNKVIDFVFEKKSYLKYGREFSGHCLPKDMLAFATEFEKEAKVCRGVHDSNEDHRQYINTHHPRECRHYFDIQES